jgi:hypothetical protein
LYLIGNRINKEGADQIRQSLESTRVII